MPQWSIQESASRRLHRWPLIPVHVTFSRKNCVKLCRLSGKAVLLLRVAADHQNRQQSNFAAGVVYNLISPSGDLIFGKPLQSKDPESVCRPMAIGQCAEAVSRRLAAGCGVDSARGSGVGRSAGESRVAAAGCPTTAKLHPRRGARNNALPRWKRYQTRGPGNRNTACKPRRPTRNATSALHATEGNQLVYAVHQWAEGEADDA